jgi:adenylyltransferase/sulfurtransferase
MEKDLLMIIEDMGTEGHDSFAPFARQQLIEWWDQRRLAEARVLVVGAGALGNEVLKNLALVGVGNISIVDFDVVEPSNLSRAVLFRSSDAGQRSKAEVAAERVAQLHPYSAARVAYFHGDLVWDLGAGVYRAFDVVLGCLDNVEARRCVNLNCWKAQKPWIDGAINKLSGSVAFYNAQPDLACYECGVSDQLRKLANQRYSCMSGVVRSRIVAGHEPTTQTTSAIVAAIQTQEAVKICHGLDVPGGRKLHYNGLLHNFDPAEPSVTTITDLTLNPTCFCHLEERFGQVAVADLTNQATVDDLLSFGQRELGLTAPRLLFGTFHPAAQGRRFVIGAECQTCGYQIVLERPAHQVHDRDVVCPTCMFSCPHCGYESRGEPTCPECRVVDRPEMRLNQIYGVEHESPYASYSLAALGIPNLDIVTLVDGAHKRDVQIGDRLDLVFTSV